MSRRAAGLAAVVALAAAVLSGSASARPPWMKDLALIDRGLDRALAKGRIDTTEAGDYRGAVARAATVLPNLRSSRYRNLAAVVHQVAGLWKGYDSPRGRTLFETLNNLVSQKNDERATQLAEALMSRSVVRAGGLAWEYYFRFGGGRPPWVSGMAQAVPAAAP